MAINDFARRLLGFDPLNAFGGEAMPMQLPGAALASQGATPNAATVAQPTLDQLYEEDLSRARMDRVGNLGMMLMAASGQLTPAQRATILAQAPAYMDGAERDAMTAAQARLYGMRGRAEQDEMARAEELRKSAPDIARQLGLSEADARLFTPELLQKMRLEQLTRNPLDDDLKRAQVNYYNNRPVSLSPYEETRQKQTAEFEVRKQQADEAGLQGEQRREFLTTGKLTTTPPKPPTKEQSDSYGFARRIIADMPILQDQSKIDAGSSVFNRAVSNLPFGYGNEMAGKDYQQITQAQRDFINAVLRRESGAAISPSEFENAAMQYFPQPGDHPDTVKQKLANQRTQLEGIMYGMVPEDRQRLQQDLDAQKTRLPQGVRSIKEVR
jgi:hypothetical protein